MIVKCRGYEGELIELSATMSIAAGVINKYSSYKVVAYNVKMVLNDAILTLEDVRDEDIEFIKE